MLRMRFYLARSQLNTGVEQLPDLIAPLARL